MRLSLLHSNESDPLEAHVFVRLSVAPFQVLTTYFVRRLQHLRFQYLYSLRQTILYPRKLVFF